MKIRYFQDADTLYIEFRVVTVVESKDLDENTVADFDGQGSICAITVEHASSRADIYCFSFEQIAADCSVCPCCGGSRLIGEIHFYVGNSA